MNQFRLYECWVYDLGCRADMVSRPEADAVIAAKDKAIKELKDQKAQLEDDCAYWKNLAKQRAEELEGWMKLSIKTNGGNHAK